MIALDLSVPAHIDGYEVEWRLRMAAEDERRMAQLDAILRRQNEIDSMRKRRGDVRGKARRRCKCGCGRRLAWSNHGEYARRCKSLTST